MATGDQITAKDYNDIQAKVASILGTGTGQRGYGQPVVSSPVLGGSVVDITKLQWDNLRTDLINIKIHQDGNDPPIISPAAQSVIRYGAGHPNTNYDTIADQVILDKFNIAPSQAIVSSPNIGTGNPGLQSRTGTWTTQSQCVLTVTFADADRARYFFNSGGKIRFFSSRTGGTNTPQNSAWTNLLATIGTVEFGAITPTVDNFYTLTNSYKTIFQRGSSAAYINNYYRIEVKNREIANNSLGGAITLDFRFTWRDDYVDPGPSGPPFTDDVVDGTLSLTVEEFKAAPNSGNGSFNINSPVSYSITSITAS